jgi:hypothetical protein
MRIDATSSNQRLWWVRKEIRSTIPIRIEAVSRPAPGDKPFEHCGMIITNYVTAQGFSQSLRQVIDFVHCGVEYHASFTKQSLSSTLEKSLAVTAG